VADKNRPDLTAPSESFEIPSGGPRPGLAEPPPMSQSSPPSRSTKPNDSQQAKTDAALDHRSHDHAAIGLFELLGLMFGLPPAEALYHGNAIDFRMLCFIAVGCFFAGLGTAWPAVRTRFPQQALVLSVGRIASDARYWLALILVGFLYAAGPEMYQRATRPVAVTGAIGVMPIGSESLEEAIKNATEKIRAERDSAIANLAVASKERDSLAEQLKQNQRSRVAAVPMAPQSSQSPEHNQGPIVWNLDSQFLVASSNGTSDQINGLILQGTSTASVAFKEAYAISGLTGHRQELVANVPYKGYYPVTKVDVPPQAPVQLDMDWNPPLSIRDFMDQWGKLRVVIVYNDGTTYEHEFDESYVREKLRRLVPSAFGPRVSPKDDK
jgi:ribosomal protein L12E/L44/L45/RPP1/RPP2